MKRKHRMSYLWGKSVAEVVADREKKIHKELLRHCPCQTCRNQRLRDFVDSIKPIHPGTVVSRALTYEESEGLLPVYGDVRGLCVSSVHLDSPPAGADKYGYRLGDIIHLDEHEVSTPGLYEYKGNGLFGWVRNG